jgi:ABC-type polysaccharide/polyol phosphate export permease
MAPEWLRPLLRLNPIGCLIESTRAIVMRGQWPSAMYLGTAAAEAAVVFIVGAAVFRRHARHVADYV